MSSDTPIKTARGKHGENVLDSNDLTAVTDDQTDKSYVPQFLAQLNKAPPYIFVIIPHTSKIWTKKNKKMEEK